MFIFDEHTVLLVSISSIITFSFCLFALYLKNSLSKSKRQSFIQEIERLQSEIIELNSKREDLRLELSLLHDNIIKLNEKINQSEIELKNVLSNITNEKNQLEKLNNETQALQNLKSQEHTLLKNIESYTQKIINLKMEISNLKSLEEKASVKLKNTQSTIDLYSRIEDLVEYGHYEMPEYLYETSDRFTIEIKNIRNVQKDMILKGNAIQTKSSNTYPENEKIIKRVMDEQKKLMLKTFNIECDMLISKINPSNIQRTLERINAIAASIEKSSADLRYGFSIAYIKSKFKECTLQYQFTLKKQEEQAEQKEIKEQMKEEEEEEEEEERARREYEKAVSDAEKEEDMYKKMLAKAKEELRTASESERTAFELRIHQLEEELHEAQAKAERVKSMAEQTRIGHVYIISNIGSFGEDVYKIGLTRRLEPMDRVKELGDASVPFSFDVHAMIYTEDAPNLENTLHKAFHSKRVNAVNLRKEFFRVSLEEIKDHAIKIVGDEVDFKTTILADEYFQTKRLRGE